MQDFQVGVAFAENLDADRQVLPGVAARHNDRRQARVGHEVVRRFRRTGTIQTLRRIGAVRQRDGVEREPIHRVVDQLNEHCAGAVAR